MSSQKQELVLMRFKIDGIHMKNKSAPKEKPTLDRMLEDTIDKKNALKRIILELEKFDKDSSESL